MTPGGRFHPVAPIDDPLAARGGPDSFTSRPRVHATLNGATI